MRVGRGGFTGSPITDWCPTCDDFVIRDGRGECVWCDSPTPRPRRPLSMASIEIDRQIRMYRKRGMSQDAVARLVGMSRAGVRHRLDRMGV